MQKIIGRLTALFFIPILSGCTQKTSQSPPRDALFCDNLAEQVQSVEQLHITEEPTEPAAHCHDNKTYAMWFPVMDYAEILDGKSSEQFQRAIAQRFQNAADLGINTVFVHVRAYEDAYYDSDLFAPGVYWDGSFDPLEIMVEEAHKLSLSIHAWLNPLRGPKDITGTDYPIEKWHQAGNNTYLVQVEDRWWLNPAYPEVRKLIADGAAEIVRQYDVDGIHLDDYFYPTTESYFDQTAFTESGASDLSAFRLEQINAMLQQLYQAAHAEDPDIVVSVSPQGTMHGNYDSQFSDVRTWATTPGYCDMLIPQVYFGFENESAPFADTVTLWSELVSCDAVSLVIGIGTHKLGKEDQWAGSGLHEWQEHTDIPARQVQFLQKLDNIDGIAIYDYSTTFSPDAAQEAMAQQRNEITKLLK